MADLKTLADRVYERFAKAVSAQVDVVRNEDGKRTVSEAIQSAQTATFWVHAYYMLRALVEMGYNPEVPDEIVAAVVGKEDK